MPESRAFSCGRGSARSCDSDQKCPTWGNGGQERNSQRHVRGTHARLFRKVLFNRPRSKWPAAHGLNAACILGTTSYILECASIIHEVSKMKQQSSYKPPGHEGSDVLNDCLNSKLCFFFFCLIASGPFMKEVPPKHSRASLTHAAQEEPGRSRPRGRTPPPSGRRGCRTCCEVPARQAGARRTRVRAVLTGGPAGVVPGLGDLPPRGRRAACALRTPCRCSCV